VRARLRVDNGVVHVEVPGVTQAEADDVALMMGVGGGLEFREVIESEAVAGIVQLGLAFSALTRRGSESDVDALALTERKRPRDEWREPTMEVDGWRPEEGGSNHTDLFLKAHSKELLAETFAEAERRGWQPPPHTVVAFQRVEPWPDAKDRRVYYRSYFV